MKQAVLTKQMSSFQPYVRHRSSRRYYILDEEPFNQKSMCIQIQSLTDTKDSESCTETLAGQTLLWMRVCEDDSCKENLVRARYQMMVKDFIGGVAIQKPQ